MCPDSAMKVSRITTSCKNLRIWKIQWNPRLDPITINKLTILSSGIILALVRSDRESSISTRLTWK